MPKASQYQDNHVRLVLSTEPAKKKKQWMRDGRNRQNSARLNVEVDANGWGFGLWPNSAILGPKRLFDDLESSFAEGLKESYNEEQIPANQASVASAVPPAAMQVAVQPTVAAQPAVQPAVSAQPAVEPSVAAQPAAASQPAIQPAAATQPVKPAVATQPAVEPAVRAQPVLSTRQVVPVAAQPAVAVQPEAQPAAASALPLVQAPPATAAVVASPAAAVPPQEVASSIAYTAQQLPPASRATGPPIAAQSLGSAPARDVIPGQGPATYASGSFASILGIMVIVAIGLLVVFVCVHQYMRRLLGNNQRGPLQGAFNFGKTDSSRPNMDKRQSFVDRRRSASIKKRRDTNKLGTARAQELLKARVTSALQGKSLEAGESLNQALQTAAIDLTADGRGLQSLEDELRNRKCEVLWVKDPATSREQLVRFVRLLRVRFAKNTPESDVKELIEVNRIRTRKEDARLPVSQRRTRQEDINAPLTFKLKLDEMDLMATCQKVLLDRLQLPLDWQEKYLLLEESETSDAVESYVETQESKNYPGLSTWYLIDEYSFVVDAMTVPHCDTSGLLGLPDSSEFQTTSEDKEEHITYTWTWRLQGAPVNKTKSGHDVNEFNTMRTRGSIAVPSSPRGPRTPSISIPQGRVGETGSYPGEGAGGNGLFSAPPTPNSRIS